MASTSGRTTPAVSEPGVADVAAVAARGGRPRPPSGPRSVAQRLFESPYEFDFFQAVRLLERLDRSRQPVGYDGNPAVEVVRFRAQSGFNFPPAAITDLRPGAESAPPLMTVTFMGLTGPSGVLPAHYTDLLYRLERDSKAPEKGALAAWLDLFNHRLVSLFYRSWEKYRFYIAVERGDYALDEPDPFHQCLYSLLGIGGPSFRNRLRVRPSEAAVETSPAVAETGGDAAASTADAAVSRVSAVGSPALERPSEIPDLALLHYAGLLAHRPRSAIGLQLLLADFFGTPIEVRQFRGQWARLEAADRTRLVGGSGGHCVLGEDAVLGERIWETESQFRICVGPVDLPRFEEYLPDRASSTGKKFFLLCHLTRMYVGPNLDFDVQMILAAESVPILRLGGDRPASPVANGAASAAQSPPDMPYPLLGPRLGWNTWIHNQPFERPANDAVFAGTELFWSNDGTREFLSR